MKKMITNLFIGFALIGISVDASAYKVFHGEHYEYDEQLRSYRSTGRSCSFEARSGFYVYEYDRRNSRYYEKIGFDYTLRGVKNDQSRRFSSRSSSPLGVDFVRNDLGSGGIYDLSRRFISDSDGPRLLLSGLGIKGEVEAEFELPEDFTLSEGYERDYLLDLPTEDLKILSIKAWRRTLTGGYFGGRVYSYSEACFFGGRKP